MKLHIITIPSQASAALKDYRGQKTQYITSNLSFTGTLRFSKKEKKYYVRNDKAKQGIFIVPADVKMIVHEDLITKIITGL